MIKKMEQGLVSIEQVAGLPGNYEGLGEKVAAYKNSGGVKVKQSLLNAISALSRIADRLNAVERTSGSNAIMESAGDYMDAAAAGNAAIGMARSAGQKTTAAQNLITKQAAYNRALNRFENRPTNFNFNRGIGRENAYIAAQSAAKAEQQAIYKAAEEYSKFLQSSGKSLRKGGQVIGNTPEAIIKHYTNPNGAFDYKRFVSSIERNAPAQLKNNPGLKNAVSGLNSVKPTGGFWAGQVRNVQKGIEGVRGGAQTIKGAGEYGRYVSTLAKGAGKGAGVARAAGAAKTTGQVLKGTGQIAKGVGQITQIPLLLLSIADEAARQATMGRQRKIIRTYNCASVLAKRMANIAQEIADAQGVENEPEQIMELDVNKSRQYFSGIDSGMKELSGLMKQIYAKLQGLRQSQQEGGQTQMPESLKTPQDIQQFQIWATENGFKDERGLDLEPDGKWGPHTEYVYNQIAQKLNNIQESAKKPLNESAAVNRALADLEAKIGITGSGGRAYADISTMSGAMNGSRAQGARAAKFIMRTYPPVLNQYLGVLQDAGANAAGLRPLREDNRVNRNYSWRELEQIDNRIQELLSIAHNFDVESLGQEGAPSQDLTGVKLPPKPVRKSKPRTVQSEPAPDQSNEPQKTRPTDIPVSHVSPETTGSLRADAVPMQDGLAGGRPVQQPTIAQSAIHTMTQIANANDNRSLQNRTDLINRTADEAKSLIDQDMRNGNMSREDARAQKQQINQARDRLYRGSQVMKEGALKNFIKQVIRESINR